MPEEAKDRAPRDTDRIDVGRDEDCRYWSDKLGVSAEKIRDAVKAVGSRAKDVEHHLRDDAEVSRSA
jgi:hypothetical protein